MFGLLERDPVIDQSKEAICFRSVDQLLGDLFDTSVEVVERDLGDCAVCVFC